MNLRNVCLGILLVSFFGCDQQSSFNELPCEYVSFTYYRGESVPTNEMSESYILVGSDSSNSDQAITEFIKTKNYLSKKYIFTIVKSDKIKHKYFLLKLIKPYNCGEIAWILDDLKENSLISYAHYTMQHDNCLDLLGTSIGEHCVLGYSGYFHVKVKDPADLSDLNTTVLQTNTLVSGPSHPSTNEWYAVYADKNSQGDAHQMANYFYETGLFEATEPNVFMLVADQ